MKLNITNQTANVTEVLHVYAIDKPNNLEVLKQSIHQKRFQLFVKRTFDILVTLVLILLFSPILITVALIIKLTSRGAILYSNERVGHGGHHFKCHKFRSMVTDHSV